MGRLISSFIASLNITNVFCKDLLKSIRFYFIFLGQKEQKSHYKHITIEMLRTIQFFFIYQFFTSKTCRDSLPQSLRHNTQYLVGAFGLCQPHKNDEDQVGCEITKDLYQIQINISIYQESRKSGGDTTTRRLI